MEAAVTSGALRRSQASAKVRNSVVLTAAVVLLIVAMLSGLAIGSIRIPIREVWSVLLHPADTELGRSYGICACRACLPA